MPHLKCDPCRLRFRRDADDVSADADWSCPACGGLLHHVSEPAQLMGFKLTGGFSGDHRARARARVSARRAEAATSDPGAPRSQRWRLD